MLPILATLVLAQGTPPPAAPASPPTANGGYTRFVTRPDGTLEMSTAAQRLVAAGKPDVWLVGAIHIGQKSYYSALQSLLDAQGAVFYEGVRAGKNAATLAQKAAALKKPTAAAPVPTYKVISDAIGLDFQLADIDYRRANWFNVDLTMDDLDRLNKASAKGKPSGFDQVKGILDPNSPTAKQLSTLMGMATPGIKEAFKILMIKAAGSDATPGFDAATEAIVLKERNKAVEDALNQAAFSPTAPKSIAVFYGAKHMADLQSKLVSKYGYTLGEKRWFPAANADPKKLDAQGKMMLDAFDKMLASKKPLIGG